MNDAMKMPMPAEVDVSDLVAFVETIRRKAREEARVEFAREAQVEIEQAAVEWEERGERLSKIKGNEQARLQSHINHGRAGGLRMAGGLLVEMARGDRNANEPMGLAGPLLPANGASETQTREA